MTEIDLSKYVGKEVICTLANNKILSSKLEVLPKVTTTPYCYVVAGWQFNKTGKGLSRPQIKSIQLKNPMGGIAQQHPNINLEDFEGQVVYAKWKNGLTILGRVWYDEEDSWWNLGMNCELSSGGITQNWENHIQEIYGEGAFQITTKDTFDAPSDDVVKKATEALKDLTEEQIAKVLHALKTK
jgi:hypothetical protein